MTPPDLNLIFPPWKLPPAHPSPISDEAYLAWLSEYRVDLIRDGSLEKLRLDPARAPVGARFKL